MAIQFTDDYQLTVASNSEVWANQPEATISYFLRYEVTGITTGLGTIRWLQRGFTSPQGWLANDTNGIKIYTEMDHDGNNYVAAWDYIVPGHVYHVVETWQSGQQIRYINSVSHAWGTVAGNTDGGSNPLLLGADSVISSGVAYTVGNLIIFHQVLSSADVLDLMVGAKTPDQIATGTYFFWSLSGTTNAHPGNGDAGLASQGTTGRNFTVPGSPGGSAIYVPDLTLGYEINSDGYVATSGKMIGFVFPRISDGSLAQPSAVQDDPTVSINSGSPITLGDRLASPEYLCLLYALPDGTVVSPTDSVTYTAPAGWCVTDAGISQSAANRLIRNCVGKSITGVESLTKTFRPGWNLGECGPLSWSHGHMLKDWALRLDWQRSSNITSWTQEGWPWGFASGITGVNGNLYNVGSANNNVDSTVVPPPLGLWAIGWDELDNANPTDFSMWGSSDFTVTHRSDLDNAGTIVGNTTLGKVKVYELALVSYFMTGEVSSYFNVAMSNATGDPRYQNLFINSPGDFDSTPPIVLDKSDRTAIGWRWTERLKYGSGCIRTLDMMSIGGSASQQEPEHCYQLTDASWNSTKGRLHRLIRPTTLRPWSLSTSPNIYSPTSGSEYAIPGGLQAAITDTGTPTRLSEYDEYFSVTVDLNYVTSTSTIQVVWDDANPVIIGLLLRVGTERMRVISVPNNPTQSSTVSIVVERGSCGTTAVTHSNGAAVYGQYRTLITTQPAGQWWENVCTDQHRLRTGIEITGTSDWGSTPLTFSDNSTYPYGSPTGTLNYTAALSVVTGPNTFLGVSSYNSFVTLSSPITVTGGWEWGLPTWVGYTYAVAAKIATRLGANINVSIPETATDSLVWWAWREVLRNLPETAIAYVELGNEPWNTRLTPYWVMRVFNPFWYSGLNLYAWHLHRTQQVKEIGQQVAAILGWNGQIRSVFNQHRTTIDTEALSYGLANNCLPDEAWTADYTGLTNSGNPDYTAMMSRMFWGHDDDQVVDFWMHEMLYRTTGIASNLIVSDKWTLDAFNTANGTNVRLGTYEGGVSGLYMPITCPLTQACVDSDTTLHVGPSTFYEWSDISGLAPGTPLRVDSEWIVVQTVNVGAGTITALRGQFGSSAASHSLGANLTAPYVQRGYDLMTNSGMRVADMEWYAACQKLGLTEFCDLGFQEGSGDGWYGVYHAQDQDFGVGDGSDGKQDNRLLCYTPGKTSPWATKTSTQNQQVQAVSTRGLGFLDWMKDVTASVTRPLLSEGILLLRTSGGSLFISARSHATSFSISGPTSCTVGVASSLFNVTTNAKWTGSVTVTPSGDPTLSPIDLTFTNERSKSFALVAGTAGTITLTLISSPSLRAPSPIQIDATGGSGPTATEITVVGPTAIPVGYASVPFAVTTDNPYTGTITLTPNDGGGLSTPVVLTFSGETSAQANFTASTTGTVVIAVTNNGGLTNPSNLTVTAITPVVMDSSWLGANGGSSGPWGLPDADTYYLLHANAVATGTGFVALNSGIILDLNARSGYSLTYGNNTPLSIANPGFETGAIGANYATPVSGWDLTSAHSAAIAANNAYLEGSQVLRFSNFTTDQTILSASISIPSAAVGHRLAATMTGRTYSGSSNSQGVLAIVDSASPSTVISSVTINGDNLSRGQTFPVYYTPGNTNPVRLRYTISPPGGSVQETFDLDDATLEYSDDLGIVACHIAGSNIPAYANWPSGLKSSFDSQWTSVSNFTAWDGVVTQGQSHGYSGTPIELSWINGGATVQWITANIYGTDTYGISCSLTQGTITIDRNTINNYNRRITRRMNDFALVSIFETYDDVYITNNQLINAPQCGIYGYLNNQDNHSSWPRLVISGNTITVDKIVTNCYAIALSAVQNFLVSGNICTAQAEQLIPHIVPPQQHRLLTTDHRPAICLTLRTNGIS